jgi:PAS domain S-box-containing protein
LRSIGDGVITSDTDGNVVLLNNIAEQLTGWSQEEAVGRPVSEVFHIINEKTGVVCGSPVEKVLELGKIIGLANHTALIAKDGKQRSIADSGAPIRDMESKVIGVVLVFRDVTDQLKMEEELLKIKKLESVGVLAGGIAHDFNNILAAILGNINLASQFVGPENKAASLLVAAEKATLRAEKLTNQLLTFSKGGDPVRETAAISQLIRESAEFILHGSKVACNFTIPDDLWMVDIDTGQIGQVVQNLILNASHAMPEGGKIDICCANISDITAETLLSLHRGDYVKITIQDTGIGIPENIIEKIFDPFFTTKHGGSGLGLAVTHSIINKHDGHISVKSEPGRGTMFTLYLPAASREQHAAVDAKTSQIASGKGRILVMDDDKMVGDVAEHILTHLGYEVELCVDGVETVNRYKELQEAGKAVDLIIMDLTIPGGMGGKEAVQEILAINPEAKVIVASGYSNDPILANCREYGFQAAVTKPFDLADLSKAVRSVLF